MATINDLYALTTATANDLLAIWDAEAGSGVEPTKKITAGNMANGLTSIANNGYANITINSTYATGGGRCFKLGKIVFAELKVKATADIGDTIVFAIIPDGFRPKEYTADMTVLLRFPNGDIAVSSQYVHVDTNGNITQGITSNMLQDSVLLVDFIYETN